jgi:glycine oxidase
MQRQGVPVRSGWSLAHVDPSPRDVRLTFAHAAGSTVLASSCLLLTAGAWSGQIAGLPAIPVRPVRGQMIRYEDIAWPWAGAIRAAGGYAVRRGRSGLLVGATVEEAGFTAVTTDAGLARLRAFAGRLFPALAARREAAAWAGLRPGTPDGLPLLGRLADLPVWVATGHYRSGILLAPWTAREVTMEIVAGAPSSTGPFSPLRFALPTASDGCRADNGV